MARLLLDTIGESMEARMREREVRVKERVLNEGQIETTAPITFVFEREETE